ncbi:hypothetical protein SAMN06295912_105223 [Sphingomonas laterariae]|uniref:Tetratricopeptide repeat-containing protein n=1 Tax=Edaphosphingomonas laterariae TaxID=861865 RepID=A0A239E7T4_9SPHN|nr:hypothetical protein [Sphingomonas laterariae]SNS39944.1 hypothetical protein SAMN06295912_105223 [Sphingomonas laterariae]
MASVIERRVFAATALGLALALATPANAARPTTLQADEAPAEVAPADAAKRDALRAALAKLQQEDCEGGLAILDPLVEGMKGKERNAVQLLRIPCLGNVGRGDELPGIYREMVAVEPENPGVRAVGVFAAAQERNLPEAGRRLTILAEQSPQGLGPINSLLARAVIQDLTQRNDLAQRKRLFVALARADWQPADRPEMRDSIAQGAIEALLAEKQVAEAQAILPRVTMPELLAAMAMERLYEPLWPAIERQYGPHGGPSIDRFALSRLEAFTRSENDERARRDAIRAFILLGRYPEAIELAEKVPIGEGMSEEAVTSVRYQAQAMAALGQRDAAVERMRPFAKIDPKATPAGVSGLVSLAEMLDEAGRAEEALAVSRTALESSGDALSPWGRAWLKRTEVCALSSLQRAADARPIGDRLIASADDNEAATIEALLCAGRSDEAARIAVAVLATEEGASALADQFQPEGAIWAPAASRLRALWGSFLARPDVKAAFDKSARILPQPLWPAREPRPIPRRGTDDPSTTIA